MPRGDKTGPMGQGAMTGRALGVCAENLDRSSGQGLGRGMGRRFACNRGLGRGAGRRGGRNNSW